MNEQITEEQEEQQCWVCKKTFTKDKLIGGTCLRCDGLLYDAMMEMYEEEREEQL